MEYPSYPETIFFRRKQVIPLSLWIYYVQSRPPGLSDAVVHKIEHRRQFDHPPCEILAVYLTHPLHDGQTVFLIEHSIPQKTFLARLFSSKVTSPTAMTSSSSPVTITISSQLNHAGNRVHPLLSQEKDEPIRTLSFEPSPPDSDLAIILGDQLSVLETVLETDQKGYLACGSFAARAFDACSDRIPGSNISDGNPRPDRRWWF